MSRSRPGRVANVGQGGRERVRDAESRFAGPAQNTDCSRCFRGGSWAQRSDSLSAAGSGASAYRAALAVGCLSVVALIAMVGPTSDAHAAFVHVFGSSFNSGGSLTEPGAVAVDESTNDVYVRNGDTIQKFDETATRRTSPRWAAIRSRCRAASLEPPRDATKSRSITPAVRTRASSTSDEGRSTSQAPLKYTSFFQAEKSRIPSTISVRASAAAIATPSSMAAGASMYFTTGAISSPQEL